MRDLWARYARGVMVTAFLCGLVFAGLRSWPPAAARQDAWAQPAASPSEALSVYASTPEGPPLAPTASARSGLPLLTPTSTPACGLRWRDAGYIGPFTTYGVAPLSTGDVWAAGTSGFGHWNGTQWDYVGPYGSLHDISALSPSNIWAVGYTNSGGSAQSLIMHWDGVNWTTVPSPNPNPSYNALHGVKALAADNVWAVGEATGILHYDGASWTQVYSPPPYSTLRDIDAVAANDIWVVGNSGALPSYSLVLHWNGSAWSQLPSPSPSVNENVLQGVAAIAANDVWAVGFQCCFSPGPHHDTLIMHWDGTKWSLVPSANPGDGDNDLVDVAAGSAQEVWAVGSFVDSASPGGAMIERWDGQQWSYVPVETGPGGPGPLNAVAVLSPSDVWAAGGSQALRYHDPCITPEATSTPTPAASTHTPAASSTPTGVATPVGTATITVTPCTMSFSDVQADDYFYVAVRYLFCEGAISGYADNTFRPFNNTTRAQLAKIIVLAEWWPIDTRGGPHFSDVGIDDPFYLFVETAYNHGIIAGYSDGTFRPGNNVTRGQLSKIIVLAQGWGSCDTCGPHFIDVRPESPFYGYIEAAYDRGIISGYSDGTFRPGNPATRGQISKIVYLAVTGLQR